MKKFFRQFFNQRTVNLYHLVQAVLANVIYGFPAKKLNVIGVTGTNGKTTTCHLIASVLEAAGEKVGMTTTIDFQIGAERTENNIKMTTVSPFHLQKLLKRMVKAECSAAIIEVTSIALDQHRLWGIPFQTVVFTNLTHDHLDYHKTMAEYRAAKEKLFANRPTLSVVNADDPAAEVFLNYPANRSLTYGVHNQASIMAKKIYSRPGGTDFVMLVGSRQVTLNLPLPGEFNVYNALAAAAVGLGMGLNIEQVIDGLRLAEPVPGRMEVIDVGQPFTVLVDYAHTPDALQKVYETIKPTVRGKLISVLGATGRRDKTKRPLLGALAGKYADFVLVTNEDPYDEDPLAIIDEVADGVPRGRPKTGRYKVKKAEENTDDVPFKYKETGEDLWWWRVPDRKEAIAKALEMARPQDVVLVTGKGAEKVMAVGHKLVPFSDKAVLEELLVKYQVR